MRRLDGPLLGAVAVCILFLVAFLVTVGTELFALAKRLFGLLLRLRGAREGQDGYTFV